MVTSKLHYVLHQECWRKAGSTLGSGFSSSPTALSHENKIKTQHMFSWCCSSRQAGGRSHTEGDRAGPTAHGVWKQGGTWRMEVQKGSWKSLDDSSAAFYGRSVETLTPFPQMKARPRAMSQL